MHRTARGVVVDFAELSDAGRDPTKQINEDSAAYAETAHGHLAVVCDGMGGHAGGRAASQTAIESIFEAFRGAPADQAPAEALRQALEAAGRAVYAIGGQAPSHLRPGSTVVALLLHERGAEIAHVGDSRAYLVRASSIQRMTRDHSMVQQMVESGMLDAQRAAAHPDANKLTRALGMVADVEVDLLARPVELFAGDVLLLASDGLTDLVGDDEILSMVNQHIASGPAVVCQELVALANARGGHDNITLQLVRAVDSPRVRDGASPTVLDDARTAPGSTIIDAGFARAPQAPSTARAAGQAQGTEPGGRPAGAAPTLFDETSHPARTTQPDLVAPTANLPPGAQRPDAPGAALAHEEAVAAARRGRVLFALAALIAAVIVAAVSLWWVLAPRRTPSVDEPPPLPLPSASAPFTVLEVDTGAAEPRDAAKRSEDAAPP